MAAQVKPGWHPESPDAEWLRWWDGKGWAGAYWPTRVPARPYLPDARRFDISTSGEPRFDIVGENWREAETLAAINQTSTPRDLEFEGYGMGDLVPEPDNPHDPNAISVRVAGYNVGCQLMPLVNECHAAGRIAAAWASVSGSRSAAEVKLRAVRADEIDDAWPRESDVIPEVGELNSPTPAFLPQVTISAPPPAKGVPTWIWVATAILALILLAIPYVGWLFSLAAIAGVIWWHVVRRRQPPSTQFPHPSF